jgi:hypothetical protein
MMGVAVVGLLAGLIPSFGALTTFTAVKAQDSTSQQTIHQPVITGQDADKETNDDQKTAPADDHNTIADAETNDDQKTAPADDHNTIADAETNDDG